MTGWSLLTHLFTRATIPRRPLFMFTDLERGSIRRRAAGVLSWPFKYIQDRRAKVDELYDVASDPAESRNLASIDRKTLERLRAEIDSFDAYLAER